MTSEMFRRPYKYERLHVQDREIRIAHLQPGEGDNVIVIELSHERLDDIAPYRALSWEWGDASETATIFVMNKVKKNTQPRKEGDLGLLTVRRNLLAALQCLRGKEKEARLWVDAICIEQMVEGDDKNADMKNLEKSEQILLMTQIYGKAEEVWIWLGEDREGDNSAQAMGFIKKLFILQDMDIIAELKRGTYDVSDLIAFMKLLKRGWFGRRWIVQEVAMARKATIHCGKETIGWREFTAAVSLLEAVGRDGSLNRILTRLPGVNNPGEYIGNTSSLPAYRLIQKASGEPHGPEPGMVACRYTLEELVSWMGAFKASRLHDTIYAILGLARDVEPEIERSQTSNTNSTRPTQRRRTTGLEENIRYFKIDYKIEPLVLFKRFIKHATETSESLDIICRPWAPVSGTNATDNPVKKTKLPSWIASLDRKPFQPNRHGNMVRCNPDPIVGPAGFGRRWYSASGLAKMHVTFDDIDSAKSNMMTLQGFTLDIIQETWDSGLFGNVPGAWLKAAGWKEGPEGTGLPSKALWRTLVAGRDAHGNDAERWYSLAFQSSITERGIDHGFETRRLIHDSTNSKFVELFRRVRAVVWNRRLIRTRGDYLTWEERSEEKRDGEEQDEEEGGGEERGEEDGYEEDGYEEGGYEEDGDRGAGGSLGLAPNGARKGDLICIIFGCSVPLVLRPEKSSQLKGCQMNVKEQKEDASSSRSEPPNGDHKTPVERYILIGECYIDHMMDGEAIGYFQRAADRAKRLKSYGLV